VDREPITVCSSTLDSEQDSELDSEQEWTVESGLEWTSGMDWIVDWTVCWSGLWKVDWCRPKAGVVCERECTIGRSVDCSGPHIEEDHGLEWTMECDPWTGMN